ncbi:MAG: Holliday junction branch migration protein RuvA [Chloroflexota bacterium]|nr:Holliday junction branch migration protein RuvA [Chloroflexota bacterium]
MIASLQGRVQDINPDSVILEIGGIGFLIYIPAPVLDRAQISENIFLYTYLVVREDVLALYGFSTREEREFFELLIGVNGVGPRLALAILSSLSTEAIRRAVFHEQAEVFSSVPGIGMKTAQKILLQLQDRIPVEAGLEPVGLISEADSEVLNALTALGYSVVEAQAALQSIPRDTPEDIETRLRAALQYFS